MLDKIRLVIIFIVAAVIISAVAYGLWWITNTYAEYVVLVAWCLLFGLAIVTPSALIAKEVNDAIKNRRLKS